MRLGVVLDAAGGFGELVRQAQAAERLGIETGWLEETERTGPALITAAAVGVRTRVLRLIACVRAGEHPLAIAEAAAVADNCTNGRLVLAIASDDPGLLGETADALLAATAARPFRHDGERWRIPANRPENDGAHERIAVTPACVQLELPLWLAGDGAAEAARDRFLPVLGGTGDAPARLARPAVYALAAAEDGSFDADALVARLRTDQSELGRDLAIVRLPASLDDDARLQAIERLASFVRPRVIQVPLPDGLEAYWEAEL